MIFESLLLDKVQDDINHRLSQINIDKNDVKYQFEVDRITAQETFKYFKVKLKK